MTTDNGVLEGIALFAAMGKALDEVGDVITDYIIPDSKVLAEDAMDRVIAAVDNVKLVRQMRGHNVPEPIKVQAQTIIKHKPPPEGASMEVSGAWFKMAQNIARWCAEGYQDAELASNEAAPPEIFDAGVERGQNYWEERRRADLEDQD